MSEIHGRCGYRCDLCPAFERNQRGPEDRERISAGWKKYYDFEMPTAEIVCAGCRFEGHHLDDECKVRPCAETRGYSTCAECQEGDSCDLLKKKACAISKHKEQHGASMPPEDYQLFIAPYESRIYLEKLRRKVRARA
ncbi:MAG: DUF3795 domain-containing protein [Acidobacteriota bacterium]